jgi:hypothetical protein
MYNETQAKFLAISVIRMIEDESKEYLPEFKPHVNTIIERIAEEFKLDINECGRCSDIFYANGKIDVCHPCTCIEDEMYNRNNTDCDASEIDLY